MSPAGFALGHTVSLLVLLRSSKRSPLICVQDRPPAPTPSLLTPEAHTWMAQIDDTFALLEGVLRVVHPRLRKSSQNVAAHILGSDPICGNAMMDWPSSFQKIQIISNRQSIYHRDISGLPGWFDFLLTLGTYGQQGVLSLLNLGVSLPYRSGTLVALVASAVIHGVPEVQPDRLCYALFMCKHLFQYYKQDDAGWSTVEDSLQLV